MEKHLFFFFLCVQYYIKFFPPEFPRISLQLLSQIAAAAQERGKRKLPVLRLIPTGLTHGQSTRSLIGPWGHVLCRASCWLHRQVRWVLWGFGVQVHVPSEGACRGASKTERGFGTLPKAERFCWLEISTPHFRVPAQEFKLEASGLLKEFQSLKH